jgi:2-C-methyl-D-erythritol 4-phosphate cytidylyltransferase / 2-C-methyl-D-erythritol 2,4-cyclodiphosphate synthase
MHSTQTTAIIIVAAGRGLRAGGDLPKQWQLLAGKPVLAHTIAAFAGLGRIVAVIHPDDAGLVQTHGTETVTGGATRAESVRNALISLQGQGITRVLIHDAARPLVPRSVIEAVLAALDHVPAAAPALPITDALWRGDNGSVAGTHSRENLYRAQTPQGFHFDAILAAHLAHPTDAADDVEVARAAGMPVTITPGHEDNLKLTFPQDFIRAEAILKGR